MKKIRVIEDSERNLFQFSVVGLAEFPAAFPSTLCRCGPLQSSPKTSPLAIPCQRCSGAEGRRSHLCHVVRI